MWGVFPSQVPLVRPSAGMFDLQEIPLGLFDDPFVPDIDGLVRALLSGFIAVRNTFRMLLKIADGVGCSAPHSSSILATHLANRAAGVRLVNLPSVILN